MPLITSFEPFNVKAVIRGRGRGGIETWLAVFSGESCCKRAKLIFSFPIWFSQSTSRENQVGKEKMYVWG